MWKEARGQQRPDHMGPIGCAQNLGFDDGKMGSQGRDSSRAVTWSDLHFWTSILTAVPRRKGGSPSGYEETRQKATE